MIGIQRLRLPSSIGARRNDPARVQVARVGRPSLNGGRS